MLCPRGGKWAAANNSSSPEEMVPSSGSRMLSGAASALPVAILVAPLRTKASRQGLSKVPSRTGNYTGKWEVTPDFPRGSLRFCALSSTFCTWEVNIPHSSPFLPPAHGFDVIDIFSTTQNPTLSACPRYAGQQPNETCYGGWIVICCHFFGIYGISAGDLV